MEALVPTSFDLKTVWPTSFWGSPLILSAIITSLLINSALEGLNKRSSRSNTIDSSPNRTFISILMDSWIPFDW